ncbi:hypothetical protein SKAU_G00429870 [Synaphobranchus kaupii]|uniref:YqaJ viral recombinase domain-containing protein n=1 Tax=Synaphobranchus kaupii TaxID=118154 RepID=A0A9Q1E4A6_SYNKA|nr:hypothetical protein SKAU_G00429870 [Synaphobranchus kaupii]
MLQLWSAARQTRLTASRFHDVIHARGEESSHRWAQRLLKGTRQPPAMKRGLGLEAEVLQQYAEICQVNVSACGFIVHPDAPHLGATPDGRVVDPRKDPPFGLVEVKCPDVESITVANHVRITGGKAQLKKSHRYYTQVQGQLAVTGLAWCDFVTDTRGDITVERVWRHDAFISAMKDGLDLFFFNTFMDVYLGRH